MSIISKITKLLAAMLILSPTLAHYRVNIPLENTQGGRLPNGSISFNDKNSSENEQTPPSTNCIYNSGTFVQMLNSANETFQVGDKVFVYNNILIGFYSPSNGRNTPNGLSSGKQQSVDQATTNFELCGDNLENYPAVPPVVTGPPIENPEVPIENPSDRTPECILNTSSDYAAIETSTGKYFFNSISFGLNNYNSPRWYYVPENYNPNNPSSYIYFDKSEQTGEPRVSGPNPNYTYAQICRVRKMEL